MMPNNERSKGKPKTKTKWHETRVSLTSEMSDRTKCPQEVKRRSCLGRLIGCCRQESVVTTIEAAGNSSETVKSMEPQIEIDLVDVTHPPGEELGKPEVVGSIKSEENLATTVLDRNNKNLDDVRENFITLISHNKLQYFILGTLFYTVINIASIFNYILFIINSKEIGPTINGTETLSKPSIIEQQRAYTNSVYVGNLSFLSYTSWSLFCFNLVLLAGLIIALALITLQFGPIKEDHKGQTRLQQRVPQLVGLLSTIISLYLPSTVSLLINLDCCFGKFPATGTRTNSPTTNESLLVRAQEETNHNQPKYGTKSYQFRYWPLASSLGLIYLLPLLIEGSVLDGRPWRLLVILPAYLLATSQFWLQYSPLVSAGLEWGLPSDLALIQVTCILLASLFGLKVRRSLVKLVTQTTFTGATQLIEAKDSLEHERQQQETLLLSVLPAYVAEQVKRNMLKTTTSGATGGGPAGNQDNGGPGGISVCVVPAIVATPPPAMSLAQASNSWKSKSFTALHAAGCSQQSFESAQVPISVPRTNNETQSDQMTAKHSLQVVPASTSGKEASKQRNSFQLPTKALTSGLAAISETLVSSDHFINRKSIGNHQIPQHMMSSSSSVGSPATGQQVRRGFNELYIRTYNNVSLLYGDIVGFTRLCTQLSSSQLVRVLNDLFSHFDHLAEMHRIMRIKILGDCYYGVSGIPEFAVMGAKSRASRNDNHAINCVKMGLDMIHYIRCLNIERATSGESCAEPQVGGGQQGRCSPMPSFELNMRIGIHSGHIHSGVIGLKKWQFDVWSNDVSIAMHCESSGVAGRVQVTQATVQQLNGAFIYEKGHGSQRDSFLASKDIQTYLIKDKAPHLGESNATSVSIDGMRHSASHLDLRPSQSQEEEDLARRRIAAGSRKFADSGKPQMDDEFKIRAATIGTIRQTLLAGETCNANNLNSYGLALGHQDIKPITLGYYDQRMGKLYANRPISRPLMELATVFLLVPLIVTIDRFLQPELAEHARWFCLILAIGTSISLSINALRKCPNGQSSATQTTYLNEEPLDFLEPHQVIKSPDNDSCSVWKFGPFLAEVSRKFNPVAILTPFVAIVVSRLKPKILATWLICFAVIAFEIQQVDNIWQVDEADCSRPYADQNSAEFNKWLHSERYQLTVILYLFLINSTLHLVGYRTRFILVSLMLIVHLVKMLPVPSPNSHRRLCEPRAGENESNETRSLKSSTSGYLDLIDGSSQAMLVLLMLASLALARQIEYINKTNFLWRNRLNVDHEELEYISGINKVLLENILPSHVVQHYLSHPNEQPKNRLMPNLSAYMRMSFSNMRNQNNDLYHEQHDSVAVMFASIPHFYEFYDESDISKQGLGCIALLNEIICDFDKLLLKNKFSRIEKIKTIGSTYMAAAGLRPCNLSGARNSTASQCSVSSSLPNSTQLPGKRSHCSATSSNRCELAPQSAASLRPDVTLAIRGSDQLTTDDRRLVMSQEKLNLICMIKFATSLMTALNSINKQSFQVFKLRVGVNTGPVIAGVIGALRPFYDIWGDCVNIASRMESLGEVGRIQVEEKTAKLLMESLCPDTYSIVRRGPIDVKGKGGMVTYFVDRIEASASSEATKK